MSFPVFPVILALNVVVMALVMRSRHTKRDQLILMVCWGVAGSLVIYLAEGRR